MTASKDSSQRECINKRHSTAGTSLVAWQSHTCLTPVTFHGMNHAPQPTVACPALPGRERGKITLWLKGPSPFPSQTRTISPARLPSHCALNHACLPSILPLRGHWGPCHTRSTARPCQAQQLSAAPSASTLHPARTPNASQHQWGPPRSYAGRPICIPGGVSNRIRRRTPHRPAGLGGEEQPFEHPKQKPHQDLTDKAPRWTWGLVGSNAGPHVRLLGS